MEKKVERLLIIDFLSSVHSPSLYFFGILAFVSSFCTLLPLSHSLSFPHSKLIAKLPFLFFFFIISALSCVFVLVSLSDYVFCGDRILVLIQLHPVLYFEIFILAISSLTLSVSLLIAPLSNLVLYICLKQIAFSTSLIIPSLFFHLPSDSFYQRICKITRQISCIFCFLMFCPDFFLFFYIILNNESAVVLLIQIFERGGAGSERKLVFQLKTDSSNCVG